MPKYGKPKEDCLTNIHSLKYLVSDSYKPYISGSRKATRQTIRPLFQESNWKKYEVGGSFGISHLSSVHFLNVGVIFSV